MNSFLSESSWEKDEEVLKCNDCYVEFGSLCWRHHCRVCGKIFCDTCSDYYTIIPPEEVSDGCPGGHYQADEPQRCCRSCRDRITGLTRYRDEDQEVRRIHCVNCLEFLPSEPSRLYVIKLPEHLPFRHPQLIPVCLDERVMHIALPAGVRPGDSIYVRGNLPIITADATSVTLAPAAAVAATTGSSSRSGSSSSSYCGGNNNTNNSNDNNNSSNQQALHQAYQYQSMGVNDSSRNTQVSIVNDNSQLPAAQEYDNNPAGIISYNSNNSSNNHTSSNNHGNDLSISSQPPPPPVVVSPLDEFIECHVCTFHNQLNWTRCAMCSEELYSS
mmetsp:Transcript_9479/g.15594  ORF Transcript_9479/g.15594 Transcript_9479/m.15594 type:complete len:329 (-) Transcript_9479:688-1674(-)